MLCTVFAFSTGELHEIHSQAVRNDHAEDNKISFIPMFYLLDEIANIGIFILGGTKHENTIWFYFDQQWGT